VPAQLLRASASKRQKIFCMPRFCASLPVLQKPLNLNRSVTSSDVKRKPCFDFELLWPSSNEERTEKQAWRLLRPIVPRPLARPSYRILGAGHHYVSSPEASDLVADGVRTACGSCFSSTSDYVTSRTQSAATGLICVRQAGGSPPSAFRFHAGSRCRRLQTRHITIAHRPRCLAGPSLVGLRKCGDFLIP